MSFSSNSCLTTAGPAPRISMASRPQKCSIRPSTWASQAVFTQRQATSSSSRSNFESQTGQVDGILKTFSFPLGLVRLGIGVDLVDVLTKPVMGVLGKTHFLEPFQTTLLGFKGQVARRENIIEKDVQGLLGRLARIDGFQSSRGRIAGI